MNIAPGVQNYRVGVLDMPVPRVFPPNPLAVDTTALISGSGTRDDPVNSLALAISMCAGLPDWIIEVKAPASVPVRVEQAYESTEHLLIRGWDGEPWHAYGSDTVSGWTSVGGGIYSKELGWTTSSLAVVTTMDETIGDRLFQVKLLANTGTPTTPAAGQMGFQAGTMYVHLPGDANPNLHVIEGARRNTAFISRGFGFLRLQNLVGRYFLGSAVQNGLSTQPTNTGWLEVRDSLVEYSANNGIASSGQNEQTICTNVRAYRCANDGFNHHRTAGAALMTLNGCDGSYNGDVAGQSAQGASNHEETVMVLNGGRFTYNVSGGMVVIDTARCDIHGDTSFGPVLIDRNMRLGNTPGVIAGQASCAWLDSSVGSITGPVTVSNGQGVGVRVATHGAVTGLSNIQSIGNALPDVIA